MMGFRYIKGDWKDFYEAPDEAMLLVVDSYHRQYFVDIFPEAGGKYWSCLSSHGKWGAGVKPEDFTVLAARERIAEWDGEGLPPAGVEFEHSFHADGFSTWHWRKCTAVGKHGVLCVDEKDTELYLNDTNNRFRPIRSEADKKKQETIFAIAELCRGSASNGHSAERIYDAIKSGKIVID